MAAREPNPWARPWTAAARRGTRSEERPHPLRQRLLEPGEPVLADRAGSSAAEFMLVFCATEPRATAHRRSRIAVASCAGSVAQNTSMNSAPSCRPVAEHGLTRFEQPLSERMRTSPDRVPLRAAAVPRGRAHGFGSRPPSRRCSRSSRSWAARRAGRRLEGAGAHAELLSRYRSQPGVDPARHGAHRQHRGLRVQLTEAGRRS